MHYNGIEKRKFVRAKFPCKVLIYDFPEHSLLTHTENISAGGLRVLIGEKIEIGSTVGLEVYIKEHTVECEGKIIWAVSRRSPYRKGIFYYDTGIEFYGINPEDKIYIHNIIETVLCMEK
jgi:c-di-GMP-binding flagellar brake protein YcgR